MEKGADGRFFAREKDDFNEHFKDEDECPIEFLLKEKITKKHDVIPLDELLRQAEEGNFDDGDGTIYYATDTMISNVKFDWEEKHRPEFTQVVVFGK